MGNDPRKRQMIAYYLQRFRAEVNRLSGYAEQLSPECRAMDFNRMVREYADLLRCDSITNEQILQFFNVCLRLADATGQSDLLSVPRTKIPRPLRVTIIRRDSRTCHYCGRRGTARLDPDRQPWHIDHMRPASMGGTDDPENLTLSCAQCNIAKRAMTAEQFAALFQA